MHGEIRVSVTSDTDIVTARREGRLLAAQLDHSSGELTLIATAISEIARNIVEHAKRGEVVVSLVQEGEKRGVAVVAKDEGPGISDIALAMQDGYSSGKGLGLRLPGASRLMDEFEIVSEVGKGTTVTMRKWAPMLAHHR
jgi:serine/threonine-protein kinase RsbT